MERANWKEHVIKAKCIVIDNDWWQLQKND
jgi:hypothetical protein